MKIPNYNISMDFKRKWDLHLRKFFADIDNYQKNEFPIVVLGRWNSGKSTLINAILGEELLPSANKEMTSILTKIYYGNSKEVIAQIEEGEYQSIPLSELKDYVNFRGNKYSESLKQIDIITDSSFLKSGISIIDTPGLSSINELNNNITYDIIPKANSIILTFSGLDVGGDENLRLIEQVLRLNYDNLYNVVFVITKRDLLNEEEALEAKESLRELISIIQKRLGLSLKTQFQICMVSSYLELKYRQYLKQDISKEQVLNDRKLQLHNIDEIGSIHNESKFEEFYKILDDSILNSENKKKVTYRLFVMTQNILTGLLEDHINIYSYLSSSNNNSLEEISVLLQHRIDIESKIWGEGQKEIKKFYTKINDLKDYNLKQIDMVINDIYIELCKYIKSTPYEVIEKNKFAELNKEISMISTRKTTDWMRGISKEFDNELMKTIKRIADIIEENSKEISEVFMQENKETNLEIYGVQMKSNLALSNFMISFAASASVGAGLFTIGNGILPGVGGIVGSIAGGLIGFIASMLNLGATEKRKENLQKKLNKYLFTKKFKYHSTLIELHLQYENVGKLFDQYLNTSLKRVTKEKDSIIENYKETKEKYQEIENTLKIDIKSIKELIPEINLAFSKYIKN